MKKSVRKLQTLIVLALGVSLVRLEAMEVGALRSTVKELGSEVSSSVEREPLSYIQQEHGEMLLKEKVIGVKQPLQPGEVQPKIIYGKPRQGAGGSIFVDSGGSTQALEPQSHIYLFQDSGEGYTKAKLSRNAMKQNALEQATLRDQEMTRIAYAQKPEDVLGVASDAKDEDIINAYITLRNKFDTDTQFDEMAGMTAAEERAFLARVRATSSNIQEAFDSLVKSRNIDRDVIDKLKTARKGEWRATYKKASRVLGRGKTPGEFAYRLAATRKAEMSRILNGKNAYEILGLKSTATQGEIETASQRLYDQYNAESFGKNDITPEEAAACREKINTAYKNLHPSNRAQEALRAQSNAENAALQQKNVDYLVSSTEEKLARLRQFQADQAVIDDTSDVLTIHKNQQAAVNAKLAKQDAEQKLAEAAQQMGAASKNYHLTSEQIKKIFNAEKAAREKVVQATERYNKAVSIEEESRKKYGAKALADDTQRRLAEQAQTPISAAQSVLDKPEPEAAQGGPEESMVTRARKRVSEAWQRRTPKQKTAIKVGAGVVGGAAVVGTSVGIAESN